jgi:hypothetical protein
MIKHELYDISVLEVRGDASPEEKKRLHSNVFAWRDALQQVVDEVESQFLLKTEEYEDQIYFLQKSGSSVDEVEAATDGYNLWKSRARTFKKHVSARLLAVKRLCQEAIETGDTYAFNVEKAMAVVDAACRLVDADLDEDDDQFERNFADLADLVNDFRQA